MSVCRRATNDVEPKNSRYFTIMIMPDASGLEVRRIRVPRILLKVAAGVAAAGAIACLAAFLHGAYSWDQAKENESLRAENDSLRARVAGLDRRLEDIDDVV